MLVRFTRWGMLLGVSLAVSAGMAACGSSGGATGGTTTHGTGGGSTGTATTGSASGGMGGVGGGGILVGSGTVGSASGGATQGFDVVPVPLQTLTVPIGATMPTVTYTATLNGNPISAGWSVDRGDLGSVAAGPASTTTFTPTGTTGGLVNVIAGLNGMTLSRQVFIQLTGSQNGSNPSNPAEATQIPSMLAQLTAGGGVGGVGGEGIGPAVSDMPTLAALGAPAGNGQAQGLTFLYPYDKTVFPQGLLAPLLMWSWSTGDADAIQIKLATASGSFSWTGTFGRPPILAQTGGPFIRMPIPQDVWTIATNTAGGKTPSGMPDTLTVSLTVAKGGVAYGPISETWTIAPAQLAGTIYYQSYGTQLAQNYCCNIGSSTSLFGGAVLSIRVGDTAPKIAAGGNSDGVDGDNSGCRVCHSVASGGSRLIAVDGDNEGLSTAYTLATSGITSQVMATLANYPAMYPDGSLALTEGGQLLALPGGAPSAMPATGLAPQATDLGTPAFSPDGTMIAFNLMGGSLAGPSQTIYTMAFDGTTSAFSAPTLIAQITAPSRPGWPAFFPDSKSVVFEVQSIVGADGNGPSLNTRKGSDGQIYWSNGATAVTSLDNLNGKGYLPSLPAKSTLSCFGDGVQVAGGPNPGITDPDLDHSDDVDHNYEPTVNPIASGGYAWVVFTSRRMYGSVATIPPFCSDPRGVNLTADGNNTNITPKKLWVAAVDLSQAPGTDSSHPAFYLPAQELLAGNARGFWTLDPCLGDGSTCMTGDQCCNGYCEPGDGGLICSNTAPNGMCSGLQDKCTTSADCCDPTNVCINGFCALSGPM
jgi:WD40-like Beta Propeller Repeat